MGVNPNFLKRKITLHIVVPAIHKVSKLETNPRYFSIDMNYCVVIL